MTIFLSEVLDSIEEMVLAGTGELKLRRMDGSTVILYCTPEPVIGVVSRAYDDLPLGLDD